MLWVKSREIYLQSSNKGEISFIIAIDRFRDIGAFACSLVYMAEILAKISIMRFDQSGWP